MEKRLIFCFTNSFSELFLQNTNYKRTFPVDNILAVLKKVSGGKFLLFVKKPQPLHVALNGAELLNVTRQYG